MSRSTIDTAICCFGSFINIVAMTVVMPFLPLYVHHLGAQSQEQVYIWSSLCYSVTFFVAALLAPVWGKLADNYGSKVNLVRASLGMFISMLLTALAQTPEQLFVCRALVGLAGGYTSGAAILVAKQEGKRSGLAQGILSSSIMVGSLVGPSLGSILADQIGMREALLITAAMILFNLIATVFLSPDKPAHKNDASLSKNIASKPTLNSQTYILLILLAIVMVATVSVEPIILTYLQSYAGVDNPVKYAGFVLSAMAGASIVSSMVAGYLGDRYGYTKILCFALVASSIVLLLHLLVSNGIQAIAVRFLLGLALGGMIPCIRAQIKLSCAKEHIGKVMGLSTSAQYIGQVIGPTVAGLIAAQMGLSPVFWGTAILTGLGAVLVFNQMRGVAIKS